MLKKGREIEAYKKENPEIKKSMMLYDAGGGHDMFKRLVSERSE